MGSSRAATAAGRRSATARPAGARAARKPRSAAKPASRSRAPGKPRSAAKPTSRSRAPSKPHSSSKPRAWRSAARAGAPRRTRSAVSRRKTLGWRTRLAALAVLAICAGAAYMLWLRDSSLVAVTDVEVVGVRSGDRERIVEELTAAAQGMSTLHVDGEELDRVGARFSTVASLSPDPNFPHGLRIEVVERAPALIATSGREQAAVAADGSVLAGVEAPEGLPRVEVAELPAADRLAGADLEQALVTGAAPPPLAPLIEGVDETKDYGVEVELRGGIPVRFGEASRLEEKWAAAAAVLADPKLTTLSYLDVRVPRRPARGGA